MIQKAEYPSGIGHSRDADATTADQNLAQPQPQAIARVRWLVWKLRDRHQTRAWTSDRLSET